LATFLPRNRVGREEKLLSAKLVKRALMAMIARWGFFIIVIFCL